MKRLGLMVVLLMSCSKSPKQAATPSPTASAPVSPSASASGAPVGCAALFEPPPGATLLCHENVMGTDGDEIEWSSYGSTETRTAVNERYRAAIQAGNCQVGLTTKPPLFSIRDGDLHLSTYEPGEGGFPTCTVAPGPEHKCVIVIERMMRR